MTYINCFIIGFNIGVMLIGILWAIDCGELNFRRKRKYVNNLFLIRDFSEIRKKEENCEHNYDETIYTNSTHTVIVNVCILCHKVKEESFKNKNPK